MLLGKLNKLFSIRKHALSERMKIGEYAFSIIIVTVVRKYNICVLNVVGDGELAFFEPLARLGMIGIYINLGTVRNLVPVNISSKRMRLLCRLEVSSSFS